MRLLIAAPDFPLRDGGLSTVAVELARGFHRLAHEVAVLTPSQDSGDRYFDRTLPFPVHRLWNVKDRYAKVYYHTYKMKRLMKANRFDYIIATSWFPSGIAGAYTGRRHKRSMGVIINGNELLSKKFTTPFWQQKMRLVFEEASDIFAISHFTARKLNVLSHLPDVSSKVYVCYVGVNEKDLFPEKPDETLLKKYNAQNAKVLLTLARIVERKGQDMVIRALPEIKKSIPSVKYIICGKGKDDARLKRLVEDLNLTDDVIFAGYVADDEKRKYYNLCDLYIMPSREIPGGGDVEGFGITYLEANACGKPVIGGRSGGVEDAVVDHETGFLVNPVDYHEIARKSIELLSDGTLAAKIGESGRQRVVEKYNWDSVCRRLAERIESSC